MRGLGSLGGSAVGALVGQPQAGSSLGSSLGGAISKWIGAGDYTVSKNSVVMRASNNIPMMHNTNQSIIVRHREFVGTINGSTAFTVQKQLNINPGLSATFPWLSQVASRFQEYEVKGMVFHYVPTSGTFNGTTAALGSVMIQTTYRATDTPPASKTDMLNEYCASEVVPFETMAHPIECDPKENPFAVHYIRTNAITSGEPLMYDIATTFVATQGMSTTDIVGDLWVTYEVELKKPLISSPVVTPVVYYATTFSGGTTSTFFSGTQGPTVGNLAVSFSAKTITFPRGLTGGQYVIDVEVYSAAGLTHATQVSWGAPTLNNLTKWAYDGTDQELTTTITGTTPSTNVLRVVGGYYTTDAYSQASITYPDFQATSGTVTRVSVVIHQFAP